MSYKKKLAPTSKPLVTSSPRFAKYIATNSTSVSEMFYEGRKFYSENALEQEFIKDKDKFNLWRQSMGFLYGKVNYEEEPIYINEFYLKQYKSAKPVFGLAPVVDAYHDMIDYIKKQLLSTGNSMLASDSVYQYVSVNEGWQSLNKQYSQYLQGLAKSFIDIYLNPKREKEIVDFKSFLRLFTEFITGGYLNDMPVTLTGYMRSRWCSPRVSGLVLDTMPADYDKDPLKEGFLKDIGMNFWIDTAEQYGFFVDKNAPWRLVANISYNTAMARRMSNYGVRFGADNVRSIFTRFYKSAYDVEIPVMSHYLAELYNNYVISRPTIAIASLKEYCVGKNRRALESYKRVTSVKTIRREPLDCFVSRKLSSESEYVKKYGELFWLRYYYSLRMLEEKKQINDQSLNRYFKQRIHPYYRVHGMVATIRAINQTLIKAPAFAPRVRHELKF